MIIVTGGAGFIGSNVIKYLNDQGILDILLVDNLSNPNKFQNIMDLEFRGFMDPIELLKNLPSILNQKVTAFIHMGACSSTQEKDLVYLLKNNFEYTKKCFHECQNYKIPFIYASSASVYGNGINGFKEDQSLTSKPMNGYALSKSLFDRYLLGQSAFAVSKYYGLRFFNVYGAREQHKLNMKSPVSNFYEQLKNNGIITLFSGSGRFSDQRIRRDFVHVGDCVQVIMNCINGSATSGIYNVGSGYGSSFTMVATELIEQLGFGDISYVDFPDHLKNGYQSYTKADLTKVLEHGLIFKTTSLRDGISKFLSEITSDYE